MSNEHDRDDVTDRLLRQSFAGSAGSGGPGPACLDAEIIAAWADGGLDVAAASKVELHLSSCAHCQALLAALSVTDGAAGEAAAPAVVPFWQRWTTRWIVPATAGASLMLAWVLLRTDPQTPTTVSAPVEMVQAERDARAVEAPPSAFGEQNGSASSAPAARPAERLPSAPAGNELRQQARQESGQAKAAALAPPPAPPAATVQALPPPPPQPAMVAGPPPPAPAPPTQAPVIESAREMVTVAAESPLPQQTSGERSFAASGTSLSVLPTDVVAEFSVATNFAQGRAAGGRVTGVGRGGAGRGGAGAPQPAPPAPPPPAADTSVQVQAAEAPAPVRWRVYLDGRVARLRDATTNVWDQISITPPAHITNGSAASPEICWLVGRGGVVMRATDGRTFVRVTSPAAVDLTSVVATSAFAATVTAADGRIFTTSDGGQTWR